MKPKAEDAPLHVRVARALGWGDLRVVGYHFSSKVLVPPPGLEKPTWWGKPPYDEAIDGGKHPMLPKQTGPTSAWREVPRFDESWAATGPLIAKHGISLEYAAEHWYATGAVNDRPLCPHIGGGWPCADESKSALVSVCHALLELKEAGGLKP